MGVEAQGEARWRDVVLPQGDLPIGRARHRTMAWFRIWLGIPAATLPVQILLMSMLADAHAPEWARVAVVLHSVFFCIHVVACIALFYLTRERAAERPALWSTLSFLCAACEIGLNQSTLLGVGSLAHYGIAYMPVLIVLYRLFLGYYAGLRVFLFCGTAYTFFAVLELSGYVPVAPLLDTAVAHPMWTNVTAGASVIVAVWVLLFASFTLANYGMNQSMRLHRYITESVLYRYLPPSLVRRAAAGDLSLEAPPERRTVTVMFTDVVGFTALTEKLGPEAIGEVLNTFLAEVADIAHAHEATIDKFIGDCVMTMFGAPEDLSPEEQATRCVALAVAIHERIRSLDLGHPLQARTGINTGEAVVGNFGSRVRSDYTALGPAVNIASRLENKSCADGILIGQETAELLGGAFELTPAGPLDLKGVKEPVEAFYVTSGD